MLTTRMCVDPLRREVTYEIEGSIDELAAIDLVYLNKLNVLVNKISSGFGIVNEPEQSTQSTNSTVKANKENKKEQTVAGDQPIEIKVPSELIEGILKLEERIRFPILWHFSNIQRMTVKDFLIACTKKGFGLSSSWLPSAGGNFKGRLVTEDKMFYEDGKIGSQTAWLLTDVGKVKIKKELEKMGTVT